MLALGTAAMIAALHVAPVAEPPPTPTRRVTLQWEAPAGCPGAIQVQGWLDAALADSAAEPDALQARATVRAGDDERFSLELRLVRPDAPEGQRVIEAHDCRELAQAAVLVVALAVDPEAELAPLPDEPPPEERPTPSTPEPPPPQEPATEDAAPSDLDDQPHAPADAIEPAPPPVDPEAPDRSLHAGLRGQGAVGVSVLPSPTAVVSLVGAMWGWRWRVELGASYWTPVITRPDGTAGGRIEQWTLDARGCGLLRPGPVELPLCAGLDVGAVHGTGRGVLDPRRAASLRLAFAAGPALVWRPERLGRRLGLWIGGDLLVALVRARFSATPSAPGLVYYTPPVGARLGAGIEVRIR